MIIHAMSYSNEKIPKDGGQKVAYVKVFMGGGHVENMAGHCKRWHGSRFFYSGCVRHHRMMVSIPRQYRASPRRR